MREEKLSLKDLKKPKVKKKIKRELEFIQLKPFPNSTFSKKRVGRGEGSGLGKTSGRGYKGQKSRTGYSRKIGFEGGQMPLYKRIPKRGFKNPFSTDYQIVNLFMIEKKGLKGDISIEELYNAGLIRKKNKPVKILGTGEITSQINLKVHAISESAKEKIEAIGGKVELITI